MKPLLKHIALALGVSPSRVTALAKAGMPLHSIEAAVAWRDQHVRPRATPHPTGNGKQSPAPGDAPAVPETTYLEARRRREVADAKRAERELAILEGRLSETAQVRRAGARTGVSVAQAWDGFIARVGAQLDAPARAMLRAESDKTRHELVAALRRWISDGEIVGEKK